MGGAGQCFFVLFVSLLSIFFDSSALKHFSFPPPRTNLPSSFEIQVAPELSSLDFQTGHGRLPQPSLPTSERVVAFSSPRVSLS